MPDQDSIKIPVTEEELEVQRRTVDAGGGVRVRKHVAHQALHLDLHTVRETVAIERVPVGRIVDAAPPVRQDGDVTVIPVVEERELVVKQLVLVEELRLTRRREALPAGEDIVLRKERVSVERQDPDSGEWFPERDDGS